MKRHGEPIRVPPLSTAPTRCDLCGLPYDEDEQQRLMDMVPASVQGWVMCGRCGEPTHAELRRVIAAELQEEMLKKSETRAAEADARRRKGEAG